VLTQEVVGGGDGPALKVSETIVRNLRVLAVDQRIDGTNAEGKTEAQVFAMVTFEATPKISEKIAVAQSIGMLSLSLRSIADNAAELERAVASGDVKLPEGASPADERRMLLAVANRPADNATTFTTGGDVSRFQRRTVPARKGPADTAGGSGESRNSGGVASSVPAGPVVRISRGNNVTVVPVGAR